MAIWAPIREPLIRTLDDPRACVLGQRLGAGGAAAAWTPADWPGLAVWFEEEYVDTGSDSTADEWVEKGGSLGNALAVGTPATIIDPDAEVVGGVTLDFNGTSQYFEVGTTTDFEFLYDGTGGSFAALFYCEDAADTTQSIGGNKLDSGATQRGWACRHRGNGSSITAVSNGVTNIINYTAPVTTYPANQWNVYGFHFADNSPSVGSSGDDDWRVMRATSAIAPETVFSAELGASEVPSGGAAASVMRLAARGGSSVSWHFDGRFAGWIAGPDSDGAQLDNVMAYLRSRIV